MAFTQTMTVQAGAKEPLVALVEAWHRDQGRGATG